MIQRESKRIALHQNLHNQVQYDDAQTVRCIPPSHRKNNVYSILYSTYTETTGRLQRKNRVGLSHHFRRSQTKTFLTTRFPGEYQKCTTKRSGALRKGSLFILFSLKYCCSQFSPTLRGKELNELTNKLPTLT